MAPDGEQHEAPAEGSTHVDLLPGETVRIMAWLEDDSSGPAELNAYQLIWAWSASPQAAPIACVLLTLGVHR